MYAKQKWLLTTGMGIPKEDLPLFQSPAKHWSLFNVSDLLYILDRCIATFARFEIFVCGPSEFAATWHHTTDNLLHSHRFTAPWHSGFIHCEEKPRRRWDRVFCFPCYFLALQFGKHAHAQTKYLERNKTQTVEPVSSTSRRGARAAYHDESPRDFGPGIAYTVS